MGPVSPFISSSQLLQPVHIMLFLFFLLITAVSCGYPAARSLPSPYPPPAPVQIPSESFPQIRYITPPPKSLVEKYVLPKVAPVLPKTPKSSYVVPKVKETLESTYVAPKIRETPKSRYDTPKSSYLAPKVKETPKSLYIAPKRKVKLYVMKKSGKYERMARKIASAGEFMPHSYNYYVESPNSNNYQTASVVAENGVVSGRYTVVEPNGDLRIVQYTADADGFHPTVTYKRGYAALRKLEHSKSSPGRFDDSQSKAGFQINGGKVVDLYPKLS